MGAPAILFDGVWKKFRLGERHDSLRDLVPGMVRQIFRRPKDQSVLSEKEFWVLRDVSFQVARGEVLGIIGQNGAGKSTALKLLTRILRPTVGTARVNGRVGALIEIAAGFHPDLTGRENIYLQGSIMGMRSEEIRRRFDEIVTFSGLESFIDTPVKRYSSGMNARLGFSIAAHLEPDVLLIDEVLAVGDFTFQQKCYEKLKEFRRSGAAIAFVSHNMQAVGSLCDRALLLRPGQPAILAKVEDAIAEYSATPLATSDPRIHLRSARLTSATGVGVEALRPGARLTLTVDLEIRESLSRCCVGFEVVRSDGVVMFNWSPMFEGEPAINADAGTAWQMEFTFRANVLRGTYAINLHLIDERREWRPVVLPRVAVFLIHEETRVSGFAELEPTYQIRKSDMQRTAPLHTTVSLASNR